MDRFLLTKCFTPLAHWIDWRFHKNNFACAVFCMMAASMLNMVGVYIRWTEGTSWFWLLGAILFQIFILPLIIFARDADRAYESRPDITPSEASIFRGPAFVIFRLFQAAMSIVNLLVFGSFFIVVRVDPDGIMHFLTDSDCAFWAAGFYFAAVPRPPMRRKEKTAFLGDLAFNDG